MGNARWNPELYQSSHSFVWERGRDLLVLLAPQPGERILDAGCGTGQLTAEIARSGAEVIGIDKSGAMIRQARANFPEIQFEIADVAAMNFEEEFDAVFSNAALHWVLEAERAAAGISRALRPGGRFVAEFGGRGNTQTLLNAVYEALISLGISNPERLSPWHYSGIAEYAGLLERNGLEVTYAALFDRPTALGDGEAGLAKWLDMFCGVFLDAVGPGRREEFKRKVSTLAAPRLLREGIWTLDYRRLRVAAVR